MKKTISILFFMLLAASLVFAAGGKAAGGGAAAAKPVTIFHHMGEQAKRDGLQAWCDEVQKRTGTVYEVTAVADANAYRSLIRTKIAAGDPADIMFGAVRDYPDLVKAGHVADITNMPYIKNYDRAILEGSVIDGKIYGIPVDTGLIMVFYNKDIFAKNNIQVPKNYADFLAACKTLQANGINPLALGFGDAWTAGVDFMQEWYMLLKKDPNLFKDVEAGKRKFANIPEFRRAVERSRQRFAYATANPFGTSNDQSIQMFASGKAAMLPNGTWSVATVMDLNPQGNFGLFCMPADNANDTVARLFTDDCFMVSSQTKSMDKVTALFNFATSMEGANLWTKKTSIMPAIKGVTLSNPSPMVADAAAQVASGKTIFADTAYQPTGQMFEVFFAQFSPGFLADQSKSIDQWISDLDRDYAAAVAK
ncbi:MAG: extracellular solute-binding protein [Treponema sp.]|nr:extracellular solute-binding protein [Treponema sp.]